MVSRGLTETTVATYKDMVRRIASETARKFPMIDRNDIAQECWLWFAEHPNKMRLWEEEHERKELEKIVARSLRNNATSYCVKEKAKIEGYQVEDLFYYSKDMIKNLLPTVLSPDWRRVQGDFSGSNMKLVSETGDYMAYAIDIRKAYEHLTEEEQQLVYFFYTQDLTGEELVQISTERPTAAAAMMAANHAVGKMVKFLGGQKPRLEEEKDIQPNE